MKLETYISAFEEATANDNLGPLYRTPRTKRQIEAFRTRMLRMDADKNAWIKELLEISTQERLLNEIVEKDKRIAELEAYIDAHNRRILQEDTDALMEI